MATELSCSFCRKSEHQVAKLVAGPSGVTICDACVATAVRIMDDAGAAPQRVSLWRRLVRHARAILSLRHTRLLGPRLATGEGLRCAPSR